jgi:hypothetical protein
MEKEAIQLYADPNLKRRVEEAAAKYNIPVEEYLLDAIEQKLADDAALEKTVADITSEHPKKDDSLLDDMRELHDRILARRGGKPIEIDVLEQLRSERDDELTNMHLRT